MSCAAFTLLGLYTTIKNKGPRWIIRTTFGLGFVFSLLASFLAWEDEHAVRQQLETVRPYVLFEELSPQQILSWSTSDPRNHNFRIYDRGWLFPESRINEYFVCNVRNVSKQVVAHSLNYKYSVSVRNKEGKDEPVLTKDVKQEEEVLYPEQYLMQAFEMPLGTIYTGKAVNNETVRITVLVTYRGVESDQNTYYYKAILSIPRAKDPKSMNRYRANVELTKEGRVVGRHDAIDALKGESAGLREDYGSGAHLGSRC